MVHIIDSTLREGMQSTAGTFSPAQSVEVTKLLISAGVDTIECGHPGIDDAELNRVAAVVAAAGDVPVLSHARCELDDIKAVAKSGAAWVGIFLGVNEISRRSRLPGRDTGELLAMVEQSVAYARQLGLRVRFTVEDATRTAMDDLIAVYRLAVDAGAERICFADTVGTMEPAEIRRAVEALCAGCPGVDLEAHLHDDRGLALANSLAAIDAGATWISTSVNGLGERAGIVDLAALLLNLHHRGDRVLADGVVLQDLSRRVGAYARSMPDHRRPVVGRDVFHHVARLHRLAVQREPAAYEWIEPETVGRSRSTWRQSLPDDVERWVVDPQVISATELRHHRAGPGSRYVLVDDRFVPGAGQYCIARRIPRLDDYGPGHIDTHVHHCDSLFIFLGDEPDYTGLRAEVTLDGEVIAVESPATVFIPAGIPHGYRVVSGAGTYLNHVLAGDYNSSLLDPLESAP